MDTIKKKSVQVTEDVAEQTKKKKESKDGHTFVQEVEAELNNRTQFKVIENINNEMVDLTPKTLDYLRYAHQFGNLGTRFINDIQNMNFLYNIPSRSSRSSARGGIGISTKSIDDLMGAIAAETISFGEPMLNKPAEIQYDQDEKYKGNFIKITLRKSDMILLHTQSSVTTLKGTSDGDLVERDNRQYEYLTVGKGKVRRRSDNDAQTDLVLKSTRSINTHLINMANVGSYVSNFEMYDTVHNVMRKQETMATIQSASQMTQTGELAMHIDEDEEDEQHLLMQTQENKIVESEAFRNAVMTMGRMISSNLYEYGMRRFRNLKTVDRLSTMAKYTYAMNLLFRCKPTPSYGERKAVSDISFCRSNSDIFVVAYGLYSFSSQRVPSCGDVYVWSIKNPDEPERVFHYTMPVTAVCFSPYLPSLIAIGLYDGSVEVRDICNPNDPPIAVSQRSSSPSCSPVIALRWVQQNTAEDGAAGEVDPFLSLSQDGSVTRYRINKSPYLLGFPQITLERVEGRPEGIDVSVPSSLTCESNRHPQGLHITTHPTQKDIFYVLTDEGCLHKCSLNQQNQYLEVLKCHDGCVNIMQFSPWSPKLFLTCGNDWYVRIWLDGISRPLIELLDEYQPVHWANWSPTHSTIIVSVNRGAVHIWDIRRNILNPMSKHKMDASFNTTAQFSNSGSSLAVGNERGNVLFKSFDDMPFVPHFQYDELEKAIYKAICNDHELMIELKTIGFFGHPKKVRVHTF